MCIPSARVGAVRVAPMERSMPTLVALNLAHELTQQKTGGGERERELTRTLDDLTRRIDGVLDTVSASR